MTRDNSRPARAGESSDPFAYELAQEKAANLARLYRRLEIALAELAAYDERLPRSRGELPDQPERRTDLLESAREALWFYIVQREVSGLRDAEAVLHELRVPHEVRIYMGPRARRAR